MVVGLATGAVPGLAVGVEDVPGLGVVAAGLPVAGLSAGEGFEQAIVKNNETIKKGLISFKSDLDVNSFIFYPARTQSGNTLGAGPF